MAQQRRTPLGGALLGEHRLGRRENDVVIAALLLLARLLRGANRPNRWSADFRGRELRQAIIVVPSSLESLPKVHLKNKIKLTSLAIERFAAAPPASCSSPVAAASTCSSGPACTSASRSSYIAPATRPAGSFASATPVPNSCAGGKPPEPGRYPSTSPVP